MSPTSLPVSSRHRKLRRRFSSISPSAPGWSHTATPHATLNENNSKRRTSPPATSLGFASQRPPAGDSHLEDHEDLSASIHSAPSHRDMFIKEEERPIPLVYSSLPPTPISTSPPPLPYDTLPKLSYSDTFKTELAAEAIDIKPAPPFSLWDYLQEELLATDFDSHQELKWERVSNFFSIPLAMEKPPPLPPSQKADILRALLLIVSVLILNPLTDASKIYHTIRGQDTIKLYVIFNALEIGDRLCASIGQDILDCLFSRSTLEPLSHRIPVTSHTFRPFLYFALATAYNVTHALIMVYQLIALNVAINSYDHALLTLLVSNQFVEIKGSVFKKFEKDNLFQITCADIVERFTLALMLCVVAFRNLIELSGSEFDLSEGFVLPKSFGWFRGNNVLWTISYPVLTVMASEMVVDWLKHAFITKFNHIRPSVYERYTDVLCRDLASGSAVGRRGARKHSYVDQSPLVARRLGFASLPLAVLAILIGSQSISLMFAAHSDFSSLWTVPSLSHAEIIHYLTWATMGFLFWICFLVIKVILGVNLVSYASRRRAGMEARETADVVNNFGRDPIGEGKEEQVYNKKLKSLLDNEDDDAPRTAEIGENKPGQQGKKGRVKLEDLTRYTMVKRI
ncbi:hypothetical protein H0H87_005485, partial [Tephrocybe sp. NHM501043]